MTRHRAWEENEKVITTFDIEAESFDVAFFKAREQAKEWLHDNYDPENIKSVSSANLVFVSASVMIEAFSDDGNLPTFSFMLRR